MPRPTVKITLFSGNQCGYCRQARQLLKKHKVSFVEQNIQKSDSAFKRFSRLGGRKVPVITIGDIAIHGYDPKQITELLREKKLIV